MPVPFSLRFLKNVLGYISFLPVDFCYISLHAIPLISGIVVVYDMREGGGNRMNALNLSENIMRLRHERKITQEELADFVGVTKAAVSKWESGVSQTKRY